MHNAEYEIQCDKSKTNLPVPRKTTYTLPLPQMTVQLGRSTTPVTLVPCSIVWEQTWKVL